MKESSFYAKLIKEKKVVSVIAWGKFEKNISNGRKIFRLLLWLNEITELGNVWNNTKLTPRFKALKLTSLVCSFFYYLTDNIVWFSNIGFVGKYCY